MLSKKENLNFIEEAFLNQIQHTECVMCLLDYNTVVVSRG